MGEKECRRTLDRIFRNPINLLRWLHIQQHLKVQGAIATPAGACERP